MELATNLKRFRRREKLSQIKLAKLADVSQQLISQIERGINATSKELPQIARALGVNVQDLDPTFDGVVLTADAAREELIAIYERLAAHPDWQAYLLGQAQQLESRVLGTEARPTPKAAASQ